ncbi:40S ribosomal protein S4 [Linum perenne]
MNSMNNAPNVKAQVVGWPPVKSFRKNTLATSSRNNYDEVDGEPGPSPIYVKVNANRMDLQGGRSSVRCAFHVFADAPSFSVLFIDCNVSSRRSDGEVQDRCLVASSTVMNEGKQVARSISVQIRRLVLFDNCFSIVFSFAHLQFKLCKVRNIQFGSKGIPYLNTYDGRTIRYPDPLIKANDTIKLDLESTKIVDFIKFDVGNVVMVTGGRNRGRVGILKNREKHKGSFETVHIQDSAGHEFATRLSNVFTIGKGSKPWVSLPKGKGIKLTIIEEAKKRTAAQTAA